MPVPLQLSERTSVQECVNGPSDLRNGIQVVQVRQHAHQSSLAQRTIGHQLRCWNVPNDPSLVLKQQCPAFRILLRAHNWGQPPTPVCILVELNPTRISARELSKAPFLIRPFDHLDTR